LKIGSTSVQKILSTNLVNRKFDLPLRSLKMGKIA